ncbi:MAG: AAA family ATPase [Candidatus Micrarchaeota archaeon]|nr:AAA family ATPase [Candidatus Micrarchaeota archaeon]
MKHVIVITGTPAVGKTTVARRLANLSKAEYINANDVIKKEKLFSGRSRDGALVVKLGRLKASLERRISKSKKDVVILDGHILCEIGIRNATAIVLREHLGTIEGRMRKRGYPQIKIDDNVVSEATDYCGIRSAKHYRNVYEVLSGSSAERRILAIAKGRKGPKESIEMLGELNSYLKKNKGPLR